MFCFLLVDYHSLTGLTEQDLDYLPGFEAENPNQGPDTLEVVAPPSMTREMAKGLFDMVPGMEECKLDTRTGKWGFFDMVPEVVAL